VPPFILPTSDSDGIIRGRGTCDAKGQIFAMWEACKALEAKGYDGFGLLLLSGEETGSYGAKAFRDQYPGAEWVVVGEPTDNCMATSAKGTKSFQVTFTGEAFHSGYPEHGLSAVEMFNDFMNALRSIRFPHDGVLGDTTWNIGKLVSDNPQNILSPSLTCRVYFRTTFESDEMVCNIMKNIAGPDAKLRFGRPKAQDGSDIVAKDVAPWQKAMSVQAFGGDSPTRFETFEGFQTKPVSFGSDAPQLTNCPRKILCGPGSILVAHRPDEHILLADIEAAVGNYVRIFENIKQL
jgi:acetylornithine deacetylase